MRRALQKFPARCRPALFFDVLSNIGNGVHLVLFPIALGSALGGATVVHRYFAPDLVSSHSCLRAAVACGGPGGEPGGPAARLA